MVVVLVGNWSVCVCSWKPVEHMKFCSFRVNLLFPSPSAHVLVVDDDDDAVKCTWKGEGENSLKFYLVILEGDFVLPHTRSWYLKTYIEILLMTTTTVMEENDAGEEVRDWIFQKVSPTEI